MKHFLATALLAATTLFADAKVESARIVNTPNPDKTSLRNAIRSNGMVKLELTINERGRISAVKVLQARPDLLEAAFRAIHKWDYTPAIIDGRPVSSKLNVDINFDFAL